MPRRSPLAWLAPLILMVATPAPAAEAVPKLEVKGPVAGRVYQRGIDGLASIPVQLVEGPPEGWRVVATLTAPKPDGSLRPISEAAASATLASPLAEVPTGGPYTLRMQAFKVGLSSGDAPAAAELTIGPLFVGDLWVLAGQSNMQGAGNLLDVTPPDDRVQSLGMDGVWTRAEEPLHWLEDSPDPVHSADPASREARSKHEHLTRTKGAGLGLPFGVALAEATHVPIGLLPCAHGGTSMAQWDPAKKGEGGNSLYGSMIRQIGLAGGKVKGILWYQGEAEANPAFSSTYPATFAAFIAAVRADLGQPDLPFDLVQLGRFAQGGDPQYWNAVRETQRLLPHSVAGTAVVPAVDLGLDDLIHIGTPGLKRLGERLAKVVLREQYGNPAGKTPLDLDGVSKGPPGILRVRFKGVNRRVEGGREVGLRSAGRLGGFSIRNADGSEVPQIYEAKVDPQNPDTVLLKLDTIIAKGLPEGAKLWYGWGYDPYCNLLDAEDMAAPAFGPIPLDDVR